MKGVITRLPKSATGIANYAFVKGEDGLEYFMHASNLKNHWDELKDILNQTGVVHLEFESMESDKGPRVTIAHLLGSERVR